MGGSYEISTQGVSREGLKPGDLVFFKCLDYSVSHAIIRGGNTFFSFESPEDSGYVHVEVCTGIDPEGRAIITGAMGGDLFVVRTTTLEGELSNGHTDGLRIVRPKNDDFAQALAKGAGDLDKKLYNASITSSTYDASGCILTAIPNTLSNTDTSENQKMFCSEFVSNCFHRVLKDQDIQPEKKEEFKSSVKDALGKNEASRVTPAKLARRLAESTQFFHADIDLPDNLDDKKELVTLDVLHEARPPQGLLSRAVSIACSWLPWYSQSTKAVNDEVKTQQCTVVDEKKTNDNGSISPHIERNRSA